MIDKIKKHPYIFFTILFCILSLGVFIWFPLTKHNFIWENDGMPQHYNALMYYGNYLRHIIKNFEVPMWSFGMGYGADIIATLHYYTIGDPLNLLSVFVQPKYTEYLYIFLILLRFFLSGMAFIKYTLYMNKSKTGAIVGAVVYTFCGYALFANVRHPYFANPMIYLPIILMGVEKIYKKESPILFIASIFVATASNFYFFYILVVFTVLYCIFRFFHYYHEEYLKNVGKQVVKFLLYSLIGIMMAAAILIPVLILFVNTSRSQDTPYVSTLYTLQYYIKLLYAFDNTYGAGYWSYLGYSVIAIMTSTLLFFDKKQSKALKIGFILLSLGLCIPSIGSFMNGMSYVTNRWVFVYSLFVAYTVASVWPSLFKLSTAKLVVLYLEFFAYVGAIYLSKVNESYLFKFSWKRNAVRIGIYLAILIVLTIVYFYKKYKEQDEQNRKKVYSVASAFILVFVSMNIVLNANWKYIYQDYVSEFANLHDGYNTLVNKNGYSLLNELNDDSFYRSDAYISSLNVNSSLPYNQSSLSFYYSLGSGYTTEFLKDMLIPDTMSSKYQGVDTRPYLEALSSSKYYFARKESKTYPYGFKNTGVSNQYSKAYQNEYALPLGYTYDSSIDVESYKKLSPIQKQEAMMQSVVLENQQMSKKSLQLHQDKVSYKEDNMTNVEHQKNGLKVKKAKGTYSIKVDSHYKGLLYIKFNQLSLTKSKAARAKITVKSEKYSKKTFRLATPEYTYYDGTHDFLVNLGYFENYDGTIEIQFGSKGVYQYDSIELYNQSMESYESYVNKLKENSLEDVQVTTNQVQGNITVDGNKFLCLSIPYSTGWSAYVDGEKVELERANIMYMGVSLESGEHQITLKYQTPGLKIGLIISAIGLCIFIWLVYINKKKY